MKTVLPESPYSTQQIHDRLIAITDAVRDERLDRMAAAGALSEEVLDPLGTVRRRDEMALACDAQVLRAIFLAGAEPAEVREACEALDAAFDIASDLPPSARRTRAFITTAKRLRRFCRQMKAPDLEAQVTSILLASWRVAPPGNDALRRVLSGLGGIVEVAERQRLEPGLDGLLDHARHFSRIPGVSRIVRNLEDDAGRLWLHLDRADLVLRLPRHEERLEAEEDLALTVHLAETGCLNRAAHDQYVRVLRGEPDARPRLEIPLQRLARIGIEHQQGEIALRESLNEAMVPWFGHHAWPHLNLAVAAARRGEDERAVACFMVALENGGEAGEALTVLVGSLCALGFDETAAAVLAETPPSLHDVVIREVVQSLQEIESIEEGEEGAERAAHLVSFFAEISHPLLALPGLVVRIHRARARACRLLGMKREALHALDRAAGLRPADSALLVELAETALDAQQIARARAVLEASGARRSRGVLALEARISEASRDDETALEALEGALDESAHSHGPAARMMEAMRLVIELHAGLEGRRRGKGPLPQRLLEEVEARTAQEHAGPRGERALILRAANVAARLGRHDREARLLERMRRPEPDVIRRTVQAHLAAGRPRAAQRAWMRLSEDVAKAPEGRLLAGLVALANLDLDAAETIFAELDDDLAEALLGRAWLAMARGEDNEARRWLEGIEGDLPAGPAEAERQLRTLLEMPERASDDGERTAAGGIEGWRDSDLVERLEALRLEVEETGCRVELQGDLERLYREAARRGDHETAHGALLLVTDLREASATRRDREREQLVRSRFENGRHRSVVALTGGAVLDENLPMVLGCLRVRALAHLGSLERAQREWQRFRERRDNEQCPPEDLIETARTLVLERAARESDQVLAPAIEAWRNGDLDTLQEEVLRAVRATPRDPVARYLMAHASELAGVGDRAHAQALEAIEVAQRSERPDVVELSRAVLGSPVPGLEH